MTEHPNERDGSVVEDAPIIVNDIHSRLNATRVSRIVRPTTVAEVAEIMREAGESGQAISIAGGRHAMGGQQFGEDTVLIDTTGLDRVLLLDETTGEIEVEAGMQWPALIAFLRERSRWGIIQKQTGADRLTLGGALAANIHGRGLRLGPIVADVVAFTLVDAAGIAHRCDRHENSELFRLAIGGYGLFGVITSVRLRLVPRRKVQRAVEMVMVEELPDFFERRIAEGYLYGDWQFSIDSAAEDFLQLGICSCYRPVPDDTPILADQRALSPEAWARLLYLAHENKPGAVAAYRDHYLATAGQVYWSDSHQLADYTDGYHQLLDQYLGATVAATEVITELYVPRRALPQFMVDAAALFRQHGGEPIYGTVRLIERDDESFLAWATQPFACVIFNLHVDHTPEHLARAADDFRRLIDLAIGHGGSFYLTYGRFATREQLAACYPQFEEFLRLKLRYDPEKRIQSEWYRHYRRVFADSQ